MCSGLLQRRSGTLASASGEAFLDGGDARLETRQRASTFTVRGFTSPCSAFKSPCTWRRSSPRSSRIAISRAASRARVSWSGRRSSAPRPRSAPRRPRASFRVELIEHAAGCPSGCPRPALGSTRCLARSDRRTRRVGRGPPARAALRGFVPGASGGQPTPEGCERGKICGKRVWDRTSFTTDAAWRSTR